MDTPYVCLCNGKPTENTTQKNSIPAVLAPETFGENG